ncbi:LL-diaminopimelate aminotransferase [Candidatus Aerophobetes bacterium]|nr:LL-diaminopimelate aminotransferase [Candidatus Aerophobetes bacterium]
MRVAERLKKIPPYPFMELRKKVKEAKERGVDVINLGVGDPVEPTPQSVIDEMCKRAYDPANHRYPLDEEKGMLSFRKAVAEWYRKNYAVEVNPSQEILALIGSKEGCHHFIMAMVNPGEIVLMTDPGYPAYRASIYLAGAKPYSLPIFEENHYLPDFSKIPPLVIKQTRAMFINYPNNPTGACASKEFFSKVVEFAKKNNIAVCHDNPYSEFVFEGEKRLSFLSVSGAKEVGIELNSLSKPYNMTGWRIGMALGNSQIIASMSKVKENTDSGIFNPIQYAAIKALKTEESNIRKMLQIYTLRRNLVIKSFREMGANFKPQKGTFYLWIPVPKGMSSLGFTNLLFDKAGVVVTPGTAYGKYGEGFIRISLTVPDERLKEAMHRIKEIRYG